MHYPFSSWIARGEYFREVTPLGGCRNCSIGWVQPWGFFHRHASLYHAVEEAPEDGFWEISRRPIRHVFGCFLKLSFQVAKLAIFHQEITALVPVNLLGHVCHGSNRTSRNPCSRSVHPGMMCRVEPLHYVRCSSELLIGVVFINRCEPAGTRKLLTVITTLSLSIYSVSTRVFLPVGAAHSQLLDIFMTTLCSCPGPGEYLHSDTIPSPPHPRHLK